MASNAIQKRNGNNGVMEQGDGRDFGAIMEKVIAEGDLASLSPAERVMYYRRVCESLGLNPYTRPFQYMRLNGRLTLYATRAAGDQLRKLHGVSITEVDVQLEQDMCIVRVRARTPDGREDSDIGAMSIAGLKGEAKANAIMKAITKGKRRVTLSICGLGWLDESETDSIPNAEIVQVDDDGHIRDDRDERPRQLTNGNSAKKQEQELEKRGKIKARLYALMAEKFDARQEHVDGWLMDLYDVETIDDIATIELAKIVKNIEDPDRVERVVNSYGSWYNENIASVDDHTDEADTGEAPFEDKPAEDDGMDESLLQDVPF